MRLDVRFDLEEFRRGLSEIQKKQVPKAAGIALGRVGTTVRKQASVTIRQRLAISAAVAKNQITLRRVGTDRLTLIVEATGQPIPLRDFQAKQGKRGVTYRVSPRRGRRQYENKFGKAFVVRQFGGNVFARVTADPPGKAKAKIARIYGPSVPQFFVTRAIIDSLERIARDRWPIEFQRAFRGLNLNSGRSA